MPFIQKMDLIKMVSDAEESAMEARQKCLNSLYYLSSLKLGLLQNNMKTFMHDMSSIKVVNFEKPKRRSSILNTGEEEDDTAYIRDYIKLDLPRLKNLCTGAPSVENAFQQGKISAGPMALMTTEFYGADVALEEAGIPISMTVDVEIRKTLNLPSFEESTLSNDPAKANENLEKVKEYQKVCQQYIEIMDELREETSLLYNCLYNMDHSWFQPVQESLHKLVSSKHSMDKRMRNLLGQKTYSPDDMELIHNTVNMAQQIQMLIETNVIDRYGNFARDVKRAVSMVQKKMGPEISLPTAAVQQSVQKLEETLKQTDPEYAKYLKYKEEKAEKIKAAEAAEAARQAEAARKAEEARRAEEAKKAEQARVLEEARRAVEAKKAEEKRKAEEAERAKLEAEQAKKAEQARLAEERLRQAEQAKQAEEARKAEELRKAEEARQAEEAKKAEQQRIIEEAHRAVEARQAEEKRKAEQQKIAEEKAREAEEARKEWVAAEQARQAQAAARRNSEANSSQTVGGQADTTPFVQPGEPVESSAQKSASPFVQPGEPVESSAQKKSALPFVQPGEPVETSTQQKSASPFVQPGEPVESSTSKSASPFVQPGEPVESNTQASESLFVQPGGAAKADTQASESLFVQPGGATEADTQKSESPFVQPGEPVESNTQASESPFVQPGEGQSKSQDPPFTPSGGKQPESQAAPFTPSAQQPEAQTVPSASGMQQTAEMEQDTAEKDQEVGKGGPVGKEKANPLHKLKDLKSDKKNTGSKKQKKKDSAEDSWRGQQDADEKAGFSLKDIPELPRVVLWGIAVVLLLLGLWKAYSVAILSAVVLIAAALVVSPLVMKYVHQLIKIGVALALFIISFAMPNQVIPIPHESGDTLVSAVQKMINNRDANKTNPVDELNLNYLGTNMTKDQFEAKYQGYQENYQGKQGVKPEEAEKILQDFLYNKKNLFANEELIDLSNGKKESVQYQVIHVRQPSEKKLTMFITANGKNYKVIVTKKKDDNIKLSKKKLK